MERNTVWIWLDSISGGVGAIKLDAQVENDEDICSDPRFVSLCSGGLNGYYRDLDFGPEAPDRRFVNALKLHNEDTDSQGRTFRTNLASRLTRADIEVYSSSRIIRGTEEWPQYLQVRTYTRHFNHYRHGIHYSDNLGDLVLQEIDYDRPNYGSLQGFITFRGRPVTGFRLWVTCWGEGQAHYVSNSGHAWHGYSNSANVTGPNDPNRPRFYTTGPMLRGMYKVAFDLEITRPGHEVASVRRWWYPMVDRPDVPGIIESSTYFPAATIEDLIDLGVIQYADT